MDIWRALGISPVTGLGIGLGCVLVVCVLALARFGRSAGGLRLELQDKNHNGVAEKL
jgi:hypothetical protein